MGSRRVPTPISEAALPTAAPAFPAAVALFIHGDTPSQLDERAASRLDERAAQWFTFFSATIWAAKTQFHPVSVKRVPICSSVQPDKACDKENDDDDADDVENVHGVLR